MASSTFSVKHLFRFALKYKFLIIPVKSLLSSKRIYFVFSPLDLPPTANAGKDVVLQLPDDVVLLAGDKSTDDVAIVKYTWTQIGGPKVQVSPSDNPYLELRNLKEGTYLIELKVEDGKQQIDTDTVTITVLPGKPCPQPVRVQVI